MLFRTFMIALLFSMPASVIYAQSTIEGNVVSATNGQVLPRATVYLRNSQKRDDITSSRADDHGHFIFQNIDEGKYEITAERQGFYYEFRRGPLRSPVEVKDGDHLKDVIVRLMPFAAITGRIVDEHEDPIEHVQVRLLATQYFRGHATLNNIGTTQTDDRGEYRLAGVRPGNYYLVAEYDAQRNRRNTFGPTVKSQQPETTYPPLFYPFTTDLRQAQRLAVAAGSETFVKFAFFSVPSVSMEGVVVNGMTGEPVKQPQVAVYWGDMMGGVTRMVDVKADGTFKVEGIGPGPFTIVASATEGETNYSSVETIEVGSNGVKNLSIPVMPDFEIAGQIHLDNADTERAMSRVSVEFAHLEKANHIFRVAADKPTYQFSSKLHPGDHYKITIPNLPDDYYLKQVLVSGHEAANADVSVFGPHTEIDLLVSPSGGHIDGMALDNNHEPVSSYVFLAPDIERVPSEVLRFTRADSKGKFSFRGVAPGSYRLYALADVDSNEILNQPDLLKNFLDEAQLVRVAEGGKYEVEVRPVVTQGP